MPEKSLSEIPRPLKEQFDRGMAAYQKNNLDYAVTLFTSVLQKEPALYECREALRAAQFRRGGSSGGAGMFRRLLGQANPVLAKAQISLRTNPSDALHAAETVLNEDPKNEPAHDLLARAAMVLRLPRTAVLSLEILFKANPNKREIAIRLAEALVAAGQVQRADKIYADLLAANPADQEVARAYKDLGARRTMNEKGYADVGGPEGSGSYRDLLKDKSEAAQLEQESRQVQNEASSEGLLAEYLARLAKEPDQPKLLRKVAELHVQQQNYDRALEAYQRIVSREGQGDPSLAKEIADTRLRQFDQRITQLDATAPEYSEQRRQLEKERDDFQLAECKERVERYPTDLAIRFELGQLYFRAGRFSEAIQELQKAQSNPHRRIAALGLLAKCFARRNMHDLAARTLQNALREKPVFDDEKKDLTYELGGVFEKMGRDEEAVEQFKLIYETDIGYRDVAARVDAYYARHSGEAT